MWPNPQETADLVIFTEEILNGKLHCLYVVWEIYSHVINLQAQLQETKLFIYLHTNRMPYEFNIRFKSR